MKHDIGDIAVALFLLAIVFILVKPGSLAPKFITAFGEGFDGIVSFAVTG